MTNLEIVTKAIADYLEKQIREITENNKDVVIDNFKLMQQDFGWDSKDTRAEFYQTILVDTDVIPYDDCSIDSDRRNVLYKEIKKSVIQEMKNRGIFTE